MTHETAEQVRRDIEAARCEFHSLLDSLSEADWDAPSRNPAWTNGELAYHMLFGFMLVPSLFWMIRFWSALPPTWSRPFSRLLDWSTPLFNRVNALGPRGQQRVLGRQRAGRILDRSIRSILKKVDRLPRERWGRGMYYPTRWDSTFGEFVSYADLFAYPVKHFHRHLRHLSAGRIDGC